MARWRRVRGKARDCGSAAVEFALVAPLLLLLVMGIVNYGLFFFDSISLRQGAREGARQAVVKLYGASCTTGTVGAMIACSAKAASYNTIGTPLVYIPAVTWAQGNQLLVCMQSQEKGMGLVPLPANGILKTKTYMSIEVGSPSVDPSYINDAAPAGSDWTWCS
jgi:Flp pilus assembly protein TadG